MKKFLLIMFALVSLAVDAANVTIGYKRTDDNVWCYTGFGNQTSSDIKMGGAIRITPEMYKDYIGAKITSLKISWCDMDHSSTCTTFMRHNLTDKEDILSGSGTLKWKAASGNSYQGQPTTINFDNADGLTLTEDLGTFYVGFYADCVKSNSIALGTSYPAGQAGAAYVWGDVEGYNYDKNGLEIWDDQSAAGTLFLDLIVTGTFTNKVAINEFITYPTILEGEASEALMTITNRGTNSVTKLTLNYACGDKSEETVVTLSDALEPGVTTKFIAPAFALGKGEHALRVSKVGATVNNIDEVYHYSTVMVPKAVAERYTRTSLAEFFESENSYYVPRYYDELFMPGYETYADHLNLVAQHQNDQWMTGDDEETLLMLQMCDMDSMAVYYPAICIDRSVNIELIALGLEKDGPFHSVITPMFANVLYEPTLARPTYAGIQAECAVEGDRLNVTISGDIAEGVIGDEQLFVTAYLLEDDVYTDSQEQSELDKGEYYHDNLQRVRFTDLWGDPVPVKSGAFTMQFSTDLYPEEWDYSKMRVVAMINRGLEGNDKWNRDILNSTRCTFTVVDGVATVLDAAPASACYDLQGRRIAAPAHGIYLQNGKKILK